MPNAAASALPPGPRNALWQTLRYFRDPFAYTAWLARTYGDLATMPALNGTLVLALTPAGAQRILEGREDDFYQGFGTEAVASIIGHGSLLLLSGDAHRRERKRLSPSFHGSRMRAWAPAIREAALAVTADWRPGRRLAVQDATHAIALEIILRVVFGASDPERLAAFRVAVREAIEEVNPLPIFVKALQRELGGVGPWARFQRRRARLFELVHQQIAEARAASGERDDVLSILCRAEAEDGSRLSDQEIAEQALTLLVAGHETTGTTLAWMLYELHRHPEVLARVREEIAALGPEPDPGALAALPYLQAAAQETLRLHPILAEFFRTVKDEFELLGYRIPAGVSVGASILWIQRDPGLYPEPERFRPERFLERRFAPWEFPAFGGGHRHCLGAAFALHEIGVVLGTLLPRFELALDGDRPLRTVRRNLTLAPERGVPMQVVRSEASALGAAAA